MWIEITGKEFTELQSQYEGGLGHKDCTDWLDFIELEWYLEGENFLRKTEQESYDEVECYPSTILYWKWEK